HAVMVASRECLDVLPEYEPNLKCDDHAELGERPQIVAGAQGLAETADLAWAALIKGQNTAPLYKQGDALVRVAKDMKTGAPCLRVLNADRVRLSLARAADGVTGKGKPAVPPMATVDVMMADEEPPLPGLDRIVTTPVFTADGRLLNTPGYDEASRLLYLPAPGLIVSAVPTTPNTEDVIYAKDLLIDILPDFPFETDSDRAAALALLLTNPARSLVTGGVPLTILEKPEAGTGASLLVDAIGMVMTGQVLAKIPEAGTEE